MPAVCDNSISRMPANWTKSSQLVAHHTSSPSAVRLFSTLLFQFLHELSL